MRAIVALDTYTDNMARIILVRAMSLALRLSAEQLKAVPGYLLDPHKGG